MDEEPSSLTSVPKSIPGATRQPRHCTTHRTGPIRDQRPRPRMHRFQRNRNDDRAPTAYTRHRTAMRTIRIAGLNDATITAPDPQLATSTNGLHPNPYLESAEHLQEIANWVRMVTHISILNRSGFSV